MSGHQIAYAATRWAVASVSSVRVGRATSIGLMPEAGVRTVEAITAVALVAAALAIRRVSQPEGSASHPRQRFGALAASGAALTPWSEASAHWRKPTLRQALAAVCAGCAFGLFIGGLGGVFLGPLAAAATLVAAIRGASRAELDRQRRLVASASAPVDLFAASLGAGLLPADAAAVVAVAYGGAGPVGAAPGREAAPIAVIAERFARSARALRAGADPETAWLPLMADGATAAVGAAALRSSRTGAPAARTAAAAAQACRVAARQAARAEIRAAAVRATAPLALCFLPAFVLVGIVPTALGLLAGLHT